MKLSLALPACWVLALVSADGNPQPCTSPDLLEGRVTVIYPSSYFGEYGKFSYDAVHQRIYANLLLHRDDKELQQVDFMLYNASVMYNFFPGNQTCVKHTLQTPFEPFGVPKNATFLNQIYAGISSIPEARLLINIWGGTLDGVSYVKTFTDHGCFPQYSSVYHTQGWFSKSFYDLTTGIQDPNVFEPPAECTHLL